MRQAMIAHGAVGAPRPSECPHFVHRVFHGARDVLVTAPPLRWVRDGPHCRVEEPTMRVMDSVDTEVTRDAGRVGDVMSPRDRSMGTVNGQKLYTPVDMFGLVMFAVRK